MGRRVGQRRDEIRAANRPGRALGDGRSDSSSSVVRGSGTSTSSCGVRTSAVDGNPGPVDRDEEVDTGSGSTSSTRTSSSGSSTGPATSSNVSAYTGGRSWEGCTGSVAVGGGSVTAAGGIAATGPGAVMDGSLRQAGERGAGAGDPRQCPVQQAAHPGELLGDLVLQGPKLVELLLGAGDLVAQLGARALALGGRVGQDRSRLRGRAVHDALGLLALPPLLDAQLGHEDVAPLGDVRGERLLLPGPAVGQLGVEAGPLAVCLFPHLCQPRPALLQPHPQLVLRLVLLGLELAALLAGVVQQFVGLGLGHAEDLRGAAGGAGAHVVHLVLGDAHHLLQAVTHAVHGAGDGGQLSDLGAETLRPSLALGELGAGGPGLAAAHVELARETLQVGQGGLTGGVGSVALGEELAETLLDLRSVETPPNDGEGQAVKIGCHRGERSSEGDKAGRPGMEIPARSGSAAQNGGSACLGPRCWR